MASLLKIQKSKNNILLFRNFSYNGDVFSTYKLLFLFHSFSLQGRVQGARILKSDQFALNGIVHIIDRVMIPPENSTQQFIDTSKNLRLFKKYVEDIDPAFMDFINNREQG